MSAIDDVFTSLLFGSGSWFGLIIILVIIVVVTAKYRFSGVIFLPILFLLTLQYFENMDAEGNLAWQIIILIVASMFVMLRLIGKIGNKNE